MEQRSVMLVEPRVSFHKLDLDRSVTMLNDLARFLICGGQSGRKEPPVYDDA